MYSRDETTLEKLSLPRRFLLWAQNASLPGLKPAWPGVCKPERRGRVKVTVYFPPLAAIPEERGSGKSEVRLAFKLSNSSVDVINDDQSGKEMLLEWGCCIPSFVTQSCCVWLSSANEFDFFLLNFWYVSNIYVEFIKYNTRIRCNNIVIQLVAFLRSNSLRKYDLRVLELFWVFT